MRCHYKRPGDWLWRRLNTNSIETAARERRAGVDWRYRIEGDSTNRTLADLIEMERSVHERASSRTTGPSVIRPDAIWGYIELTLSSSLLAFALFVSGRADADPHAKYSLTSAAVFW